MTTPPAPRTPRDRGQDSRGPHALALASAVAQLFLRSGWLDARDVRFGAWLSLLGLMLLAAATSAGQQLGGWLGRL